MPHSTTCLPVLLGAILSAATSGPCPAQSDELRVDPARIERDIRALSAFGKTPYGTRRVAFSKADVQGRAFVTGLMRDAGLEVTIDAAGNLIGHRDGKMSDLPPISFGSHIDTVPHGGNYDGCVGSIGAIECVRVLREAGVVTRHPLEVIIFSDEEGGLVGSRALIGQLSEDALKVISHSGRPIGLGIKYIGGDPERLAEVVRRPGDIRAFLELHIEQGAVLHRENIRIGIVEGIVGINWWDVIIEGAANHAGTTPMDQRRDALLAAARLVVAVNEVVTGVPGRQVGTVGRIRAQPGAPNVIPGRVVMSLELRDLSADKIDRLYVRIRGEAKKIAEDSSTSIRFEPLDVTAIPAVMDKRMRAIIAQSATALGLSAKSMPSGAGHDAQDMAKLAPTGMIFVPSIDGISHSPKERTTRQAMADGANVLLHSILAIDRGDSGRDR